MLLAMAVTLLVLAFLSLLEDSTPTVLIVASAVCLSAANLIIYITLEFFIFKEISNI
jgi:two-component system phosphate regulon sensor histidine kinase PhoR